MDWENLPGHNLAATSHVFSGTFFWTATQRRGHVKKIFQSATVLPPPPTERLHASMKHQQRSAIYFQAQQETAASKPREEKKIKHKQLLFAYSDLRFGRSRSSKVNLLSSGFLSTIKTGFNSTFSECRCKDAEHFRLCESLRAPSAV